MAVAATEHPHACGRRVTRATSAAAAPTGRGRCCAIGQASGAPGLSCVACADSSQPQPARELPRQEDGRHGGERERQREQVVSGTTLPTARAASRCDGGRGAHGPFPPSHLLSCPLPAPIAARNCSTSAYDGVTGARSWRGRMKDGQSLDVQTLAPERAPTHANINKRASRNGGGMRDPRRRGGRGRSRSSTRRWSCSRSRGTRRGRRTGTCPRTRPGRTAPRRRRNVGPASRGCARRPSGAPRSPARGVRGAARPPAGARPPAPPRPPPRAAAAPRPWPRAPRRAGRAPPRRPPPSGPAPPPRRPRSAAAAAAVRSRSAAASAARCRASPRASACAARIASIATATVAVALGASACSSAAPTGVAIRSRTSAA